MNTSAAPLKPQVFAILRALIEERSGLHYKLSDIDLIADKVSTRVLEAGFDSALDYYYYLRYDPGSAAELDALLESLVVQETYFFRELESLKQLVSHYVAPLVDEGKRPRIWSAACATGEEPLTLAMLLGDRGMLRDVEIVATDLSARALARAQTGEFGPRALRERPPDRLDERWLDVKAGRIRVREELVSAIQWRRVNLLDEGAIAALGKFDAIVCRNVLIYFNDETTRRVIANLAEALLPGSPVLLGVSESLFRLDTPLVCEERGGVFFYRKEP